MRPGCSPMARARRGSPPETTETTCGHRATNKWVIDRVICLQVLETQPSIGRTSTRHQS